MSKIILTTEQIKECHNAKMGLNITTIEFIEEVKNKLKELPEGDILHSTITIIIKEVKELHTLLLK